MKKLVAVLVISMLGVIPAAAQSSSGFSVKNVFNQVIRTLTGKPEWVNKVRHEEWLLSPGVTGTSFYTFSTKSFEQQPVRKDKELFEFRKSTINGVLAGHHTLDRYTLVVPIPADLTMISQEEMDYLMGFLRQPSKIEEFDKAYTPYSVNVVEKAVVEIKLQTPSNNILILRVDCLKSRATDDGFKHIVYFFLNEY